MTPKEKLSKINALAKRKGIKGIVETSTRDSKKYMIVVNGKKIHFGQRGAQDFWDHRDKDRRKNYLSRAKGIRDGDGKLTHKRRTSANFYSIELLW